jgi:DNA-binding GntR family transcriptional regulator
VKSDGPKRNELKPIRSKSLVEEIVEAIVEATATGVFLPGDRIVEAEVARSLNVSRIPVREALRTLESQGVVVSERFRGMRLMSVDIERLEKILKVRLALECLAGAEVLERLEEDPTILAPLEEIAAKMHEAGERDDGYLVARLDTQFHRCLCELSGNEALVQSWEPLSRQLTIIFGLSTLKKQVKEIVLEHDEVLKALKSGNQESFNALMQTHILEYSRAVDYEQLVEQLRTLNGQQKVG